MKKNGVLIVDDEKATRELFSMYLRLQGLDIETAGDGVEGLNKFTSHPFDVVLTDIQMPHMDGLSLSKEIKKIQSQTAIIIMTGDDRLALQAESVADFVLVKPFGLSELYEKLQCCIGKQAQIEKSQTELRKSKRLRHESLITVEDDFGFPYYGMIYNLNHSGLYFHALNDMPSGKSIQIQIEDLPPELTQNSFAAKVVWSEKLNDYSVFRYGIGIKYC
jgi:CheY-like chemotaxis protein